MSHVQTVEITTLQNDIPKETIEGCIRALESGSVVFLPKLIFSLLPEEEQFLTPSVLHPKHKNVSFDPKSGDMKGVHTEGNHCAVLAAMMKRFAIFAQDLLQGMFPHYLPKCRLGRTSFRPVEAAGRKTSLLKDDTLLHVDAFPTTPLQGDRILRVFANINPEGRARVWKVGEPFADLIDKLACRLKKPFPGYFQLLNALRITKGKRSLYDHYMLQLHDTMKKDPFYQAQVPSEKVDFPSGSVWLAYTDIVSHAVLSGQFVLEQTFYLPPSAMRSEQQSPLRILEKRLSQRLV